MRQSHCLDGGGGKEGGREEGRERDERKECKARREDVRRHVGCYGGEVHPHEVVGKVQDIHQPHIAFTRSHSTKHSSLEFTLYTAMALGGEERAGLVPVRLRAESVKKKASVE